MYQMVLNKEELYLPYCLVVTLINSFGHVGASYAGAFGYADDIAPVFPYLQSVRKMISICEQFAKTHSITFNPNTSKLLCSNVDEADDIPPIYLNGEVIPSIGSDKHLGNYVSTDIADRYIVDNVYDLYQNVTGSLVTLEYVIVAP